MARLLGRNLILSGGVAHDFARTSSMLVEVLRFCGIESDVCEDFAPVEDGRLMAYDMVTLNCARWTCSQPQVPQEWREKWAFSLSDDARKGFFAFLAEGKGMLALHAATICFDDWPEYRKILGAWWEWGHSGHPPFQRHTVRVHTNEHLITKGVRDFEVEDELYIHPRITDEVSPLAEGEWEGKKHPLLWIREYGPARICYNALGHGPEAFEHFNNQVLLRRSALWVLKLFGRKREKGQ